jgi:predicted MFS family arabinose efflux permease
MPESDEPQDASAPDTFSNLDSSQRLSPGVSSAIPPTRGGGGPRHGRRRPKHSKRKNPLTERVKMLRPLQIRDFSLLWWGLTVSLLGDGIFIVALPFQVREISNSVTALTYALVAWTLPLVLFFIVGGVLSDRLERRRVLMFANALQGSAILGLGLLSVTGVIELWHVYMLAGLYGLAEALFGPAFGAIVPDLVPRDLLVEANALDNFSRPFALRVIGPAFGGIIIAVVGVGGAFLLDAVTFVFAGVVFALISRRKLDRDRALESVVWEEVREGYRFVRSHTWLWGTLLAFAVGLLVFSGPWQALVPFVVLNRWGGASDLALVLSAGGIGAMVSSVLIGTRNLPARFITSMFLGMAVGTLMLAGFGLATSTWHAAIASFIMQGLLSVTIITWNTTMHRYVPGNLLGRVSSLDWMVSTSLIPVSLALTGPLAQTIGARATLVGAGVFGSVAVLLFLLIPGIREPEQTAAAEKAIAQTSE